MGRGIRILALLIALAGGFATVAAAEGRLVVVFADASMSVSDEDWKKKYWAPYLAVCERLGQGDRIVFAPITGRSLTGYAPLIDREFRKRTGRSQTDRLNLAVDRKASAEAFGQMKRGEKKSQIMDATVMAADLFSTDPVRTDRWLVILSDMLESSEGADFEKTKLDEKKVQSIIEARKKKGLLPKLEGVHLFVGGASGPNAERYAEVRRFWEAYFKETGAVLDGDGWYSAATPRLPAAGSR